MAGPAATVGYLSDRETKIDFLNNGAIATTIVRLLGQNSDHPITIGVHGDWGAGKSSVLEMVEAALSEENKRGAKILCLKFNGWQFQGFEDAKIALIEKVVDGLVDSQGLLTKATDQVKEILKSIDWMKVATKGGGLAFTALTGLPALGVAELIGAATEKISNVIQDKDSRESALKGLAEIKKEKEAGNAAGKNIPREISAFRKQFKELIKKADLDRLVVLVDDLDRCLPKTSIETLEAIRLFVLMEKTAFVIAADEQMIEYAVKEHFPDLPDGRDGQGYARAYLEKLIQVPLRIPALGETETRIYVTLLLLGAQLGDDEKTFNAMLDLGRKALSKPWEGKSFEDEEVKAALGERIEALRPALTMAEQISPVLSAGTKGNPRQIKRFLNALTLRLAVADARNFGDAIEQTRLAKLMLAELYLPESVFSHIAQAGAASPDGRCQALAALEGLAARRLSLTAVEETAVADNESGEQPKPEAPAAVPDDVKDVVTEWSSYPEVMRWARIQPELGDVGLRPYLFVIKDKRNYLLAEEPLPPKLAALLPRLTSGQTIASSVQADVVKLGASEHVALFDALKRAVLAATSFETKPAAMFGVEVMVKANAILENRYVDLLDALPAERLGPWAAVGHGPLVKRADSKARLETVIAKWRKSGAPALKRAISSADKAPDRPKRHG